MSPIGSASYSKGKNDLTPIRAIYNENPINFADLSEIGVAGWYAAKNQTQILDNQLRGCRMNPTYFKKDEYLESARQARARQMNLPPNELIKAKLAQLQSFVSQLEKTEYGRADLRARVRAHGACTIEAGETDRQFYGKLRKWLDRDV
jgi:hypothetical protein